MLERIRIVLAQPRHPGNIGAAARAMKVMGLTDLALVAPLVHPSDEATARASSAVDVLDAAPVTQTLDDAVSDCAWIVGLSARERYEGPDPMTVEAAAAEAVRRAATAPVAFVFGNERSGLSNEELLSCHALAHIPTGPLLSSLNLGAAVQVVAYEVRRALDAGRDPEITGDPPAARAVIDALVARAWALAERSPKMREDDPRLGKIRERLGRVLARAAPTEAEAKALHGLLTWLEQPSDGP